MLVERPCQLTEDGRLDLEVGFRKLEGLGVLDVNQHTEVQRCDRSLRDVNFPHHPAGTVHLGHAPDLALNLHIVDIEGHVRPNLKGEQCEAQALTVEDFELDWGPFGTDLKHTARLRWAVEHLADMLFHPIHFGL